jgi:hypothetical protein
VTVGTVSGKDAQQAQAELVRRQINAIKEQTEEIRSFNKGSEKTNRGVLLFTAVLLFVGLVQIIVTILASNISTNWKGVLAVSAIGFIVFIMWKLDKEVGNQ